jgi:hypothetical protein
MSWRNYVIGTVNAGPVHISCDGRNPGDHPKRVIAIWWCQDGVLSPIG